MSTPCIISVAITGSLPRKKDNPAVPITVAEQVESTHAAYEAGATLGLEVAAFQSNHEGALVDRIHAARDEGVRFVVINPGALTHTSVALRDALTGVAIPFIEVHISNVHKREAFRHHSYLSDVAEGVIVGLGTIGYRLALQAAAATLQPGVEKP